MRSHRKALFAGSSMRQGTNRPKLLLAAAAALALTLLLGVSLANATAPAVTVENATEVASTTAKVKGTVDSQGQSTSWRFQYITDDQCEENVNVNSLPCFEGASDGPSGTIEEGTATVKGKLTGLAPDTTYRLRLLAENADGTESEEAPATFHTEAVQAPTVTNVKASNVEFTRAKASGTVSLAEEDPGFDASCRFEYVTQEHFETEGEFENPNTVPCEPQTIAATSPQPVGVKAELSGLTPATTYHLRLVASNLGGETKVPAPSTFTTGTVSPPSVTAPTVSALTGTSAHFSSEVGPGAPGPAPQDPAFDITWHFQCAPPGPTACHGLQGGTIEGDDATHTVEADADQLQPNTTSPPYTVKIVAENGVGQTSEATTSFATPAIAPTINSWAAGPVQSDQADINGEVDPQNSPTTYWFEWGTEDCETSSCQSLPSASAGSGPLYVYVSEHLSGLSPATTYHFRLIAENSAGTTEGPDQEFTTAAAIPSGCANEALRSEQHSTFLPGCRAYEMVSPPDKHGIDVIPQSNKTHLAVDGNGASFSAGGAFGEVEGTSVDTQYLSRRDGAPGTNGWSTHAINPPGSGIRLIALLRNMPTFEAAFTPDLSGAIYRSWRPLTDEPNVADVSNLYRLSGLDASEPGVQLLTPAVMPLAPVPPSLKIQFRTRFAGASSDLRHVIFQSPWNLPGSGGFSFGGNLYEYADGVGVRRVGRVPSGSDTACDDIAGSPCVDAPSAWAGIPVAIFGAQQYSSEAISEDGARIVFQVPAGPPEGALYLREDGVRTFQLNASEKTTPEETPGTATFWGMSDDGSRLFFTTREGLVDADADGGERTLYMYDRTAPSGSRLTPLTITASGKSCDAEAMLGASDDGHYVYFVCGDQLVPGEPTVGRGLFLWHDGELAYVGDFAEGADVGPNTPRTNWEFITRTKTSRVTPDGRHLLFMATRGDGFAGRGGFAGYDHGTTCTFGGATSCRELYLYNADSGRLLCASCNPLADVATGNALIDVRAATSGSAVTQHLSHALADDGNRVFFSSPEALVPEDTNDAWDAYEYDVPSGALQLLSSGTDPADSYFLEASADGADVLIATRQRLLGWDNDSSYDLYDARLGGGFPEPAPVPAACAGESCLSASAPAPPAQPTASQSPSAGNRHACPRGKRRLKGRCVAKHRRHAKHRKHRRAGAGKHRANPDRRASR